jgi:hypothetical protein
MGAPTLQVEFSFTRNGNDYVWNDISSYVRSVSIDRGISRELEEYSAGQCEVMLSNNGRQFDPSYLSPTTTRTNLVKNPIPSTTAAVSPQETWQMLNRGTGGAGTTTLTANGAVDTVTTAASTVVYSFGVTGGTTAARIPVTAGVTYAFSMYVTSSVSDTRRLAATFYDTGGSSLGDVGVGVAQTLLAGVETQLIGTYTAPAGAVSVRMYGGNTTGSVIRPLGSTMTWRRAMVEQASSVGTYFDGSTSRTPNTQNAWSGTAQASSSTQTIYPSLYGRDVKPAGAIRVTSGGYVQFLGFIDNWTFDYPQSNSDAVARVIAYDSLATLSKTVLDETYFTEQTTGSRIAAILSRPEVAVNSALQDLDGGSSIVSDELVAQGTGALGYAQQVAHSEPGDLFATRDGKLAFRDRRYLDYNWNPATYRYNLCTNPSFESGVGTAWALGAISTLQEYYGTQSLVGSYNASLNIRQAKYDDVNAAKYGATGTGSYTLSAWFYLSGGTVNLTFTSKLAGATVSTASSSPAITLNTWTRVSLTLSVGSSFDELELIVDNGSGSSIFYIDGVLIEKSASMGDYFDGAITPTASSTIRYTSEWDTATNLSTSTLAIQTLNSSASPDVINLSDASGSDIPVIDIRTIYASEQLYNRIILVGTSTDPQLRESPTSQADYGIRGLTDESYLNADDDVLLGIAGQLLTQLSQPEFRAEEVAIALNALDSTDQSTLLQADIRDVIQLTYKPSKTGTQLSSKYAIIGVGHNIEGAEHFLVLKIASLANYAFRLDSAVLGVLDTNLLSYPN